MTSIKGVILAGGYGTRLHPLTKVINKHLLPVYNKPMIYYAVEKLVDAGISQIMVVTGGNNAGSFLELLGNGKDFGLEEIHYAFQEKAGGIAEALALTKGFLNEDKVVVMLGDNILEDNINDFVNNFKQQSEGAKILLKEVSDSQRFGVASIDKNGLVTRIVEKPKSPDSSYAVIGIYMYDKYVFDIISTLKRSNRGELEITDVNNAYLKQGTLTSEIIQGWWTDAGTIDSLYYANELVKKELEK
jgi:glucose-1-phosphate thymidylyltransferase